MKNQRGYTAADLAELCGHPTLSLHLKRSIDPQASLQQSKEDSSSRSTIPISDLSVYVPSPYSLPPSHLPHPDHLKYNKFPYVNDGCNADKSLLYTEKRLQHQNQNVNITMNGESIVNFHTRQNGNITQNTLSETSSSGAFQNLHNCVSKDNCSRSSSKSKRLINKMEDDIYSEDSSGRDHKTSPKRRCFGVGK